MRIDDGWWRGFQGNFETEEEIIEFIVENIDTCKWEDSYANVGGHKGEPNELVKVTVDDKLNTFYEFLMEIIERKEYLEQEVRRLKDERDKHC